MSSHWMRLHFLCVVIVNLCKGQSGVWSYYGANGPDHWYLKYATCKGSSQSPINIDSSKAELDMSLSPLVLRGYDKTNRNKLNMENNGHTGYFGVACRTFSSFTASYTACSLNNTAMQQAPGLTSISEVRVFAQFCHIERPTDLRLRNTTLIHIVHYATPYHSMQNAMDKTAGLAVLSILFKIGVHNDAFDEILPHLNDIPNKDEHTTLSYFSLESILPGNRDVYYRYYGSLTTPPCYESVIWTVFESPIEISEDQINRIRRKLHENNKGSKEITIDKDFRPLQPLNNRHVYASDPRAVYISGACVFEQRKTVVVLQSLIISIAFEKLLEFNG